MPSKLVAKSRSYTKYRADYKETHSMSIYGTLFFLWYPPSHFICTCIALQYTCVALFWLFHSDCNLFSVEKGRIGSKKFYAAFQKDESKKVFLMFQPFCILLCAVSFVKYELHFGYGNAFIYAPIFHEINAFPQMKKQRDMNTVEIQKCHSLMVPSVVDSLFSG